MRLFALLLLSLLLTGCASVKLAQFINEKEDNIRYCWIYHKKVDPCPVCHRCGHYNRSAMTDYYWNNIIIHQYGCLVGHQWVAIDTNYPDGPKIIKIVE